MAGEKTFTQIPPSSTGKKVLLRHAAYLPYTNRLETFLPNATYTGASSGLTFVVNKVFTTTSTTGTLEVVYDEIDLFNNVEPIANENILDQNSTIVAQVSNTQTTSDIAINTQEIIGSNNPSYGMFVDVFGAANVRFSEGRPQISAAGQLRTTPDTLLANYSFVHDAQFQKFSNSLRGSGSVSYDKTVQSVKLQTETSNNELTTHTSDFYHPFVPGATTLYRMATRCGDSGKNGVIRRWGAFDPNDGFFFEVNGNNIYVTHRYTINGVRSEQKVLQTNWNNDTLDGSGDIDNPSGLLLDITTNNQYWYDYSYLGGGQARWGIIYNGNRVIVHIMDMSNGLESGVQYTPPIGIPNLPICWSQYNSGSIASPSQIYALGGSVFTESDIDYNLSGRFTTALAPATTIPSGSISQKYMFTLQPALRLQDGTFNRSFYTPKELEHLSYNVESSNDDLVKVKLSIYQGQIIRGESFSNVENSSIQIENSGESLSGGDRVTTLFCQGNFKYDFSNIFKSVADSAFFNKTEFGTGVQTQTINSISDDVSSLSENSPTLVEVGPDRIGKTRHIFRDFGEVTVDSTGTTLDSNTYYLSLVTYNTNWLYNTTSSIQEDRKLRTLYLDSTGSLNIGDRITVVGYGSASVQSLTYDVSSGTGSIALEGRNSNTLDVGSVIIGTEVSQSTTGVGNVFYIDSGSVNSYPKDYKTSLNAVTGVGTGTSGNYLGNQPVEVRWTFMVEPITPKSFDIKNELQFGWLENIQ
jgi:hypothetical protein